MTEEMLCGECEDGEGRVFHEEDRVWYPCSTCGPVVCVSCLKKNAGLDGLCEKCARPASTESVCEREGPVSRLLDGDVVHLVPHESGEGAFQAAVLGAFYERTLGDVA